MSMMCRMAVLAAFFFAGLALVEAVGWSIGMAGIVGRCMIIVAVGAFVAELILYNFPPCAGAAA